MSVSELWLRQFSTYQLNEELNKVKFRESYQKVCKINKTKESERQHISELKHYYSFNKIKDHQLKIISKDNKKESLLLCILIKVLTFFILVHVLSLPFHTFLFRGLLNGHCYC